MSDLLKETRWIPASGTFDMTPVNISKKKKVVKDKLSGTAVMINGC